MRTASGCGRGTCRSSPRAAWIVLREASALRCPWPAPMRGIVIVANRWATAASTALWTLSATLRGEARHSRLNRL